MQKLKEELLRSIHHLDPLDKLKKQIEITITAEGLRIELMESAKGTFFELGSAKPTPALIELLKVLSEGTRQAAQQYFDRGAHGFKAVHR